MRKRALRCSALGLALLLQCLTLPARALACVVGTCTESALDACLPAGERFTGTVTFNCGGFATITVTSTKTISADTSIDGGSLITISGGNAVGVFSVDTGVNFTVQNLTIANGTGAYRNLNGVVFGGGIYNNGTLSVTNSTFSANSASDHGGGIYNGAGGTLTVTNSTFSGNSANGGGGIWSGGGTLTVTSSTFSGNSAGFAGGGILNSNSNSFGIFSGGGMLTVTDSTFSGNSAGNAGGGIDSIGGTLTVTDSSFSGNSANASGGGIYNSTSNSGGGMLTVTDSTFSGNNAGNAGGGIFNVSGGIPSDGAVTVTNSTFSGNSATGLGNSYGGGISNDGTLTVTNSTFSGNSADVGGGGIYNRPPSYSVYGTLTVTNSTFSGNSAGEGGGIDNYYKTDAVTVTNTIVANSTSGGNCAGGVTDGGHNLDDGTTCSFSTANGSLSNTNPLLDPVGLRNNGGWTQTIALLPGSPAIDGGDPTGCKDPHGVVLTTDQRGALRPIDGNGDGTAVCDIGAYEAAFHASSCQTRPLIFIPGIYGSTLELNGQSYWFTTNNCLVSRLRLPDSGVIAPLAFKTGLLEEACAGLCVAP